MPENADIPQLSSYLTACEALAESIFSDLPSERRIRVANWSMAIMESLRDEDISVSDLHLILGTLAGIAVREETVPEGVKKQDLRDHARNLMIGTNSRSARRAISASARSDITPDTPYRNASNSDTLTSGMMVCNAIASRS